MQNNETGEVATNNVEFAYSDIFINADGEYIAYVEKREAGQLIERKKRVIPFNVLDAAIQAFLHSMQPEPAAVGC